VNGRVQTQDVEGLVEAVNATGLKIGGAWVNVSRFHPVTLPESGAHVRMKVRATSWTSRTCRRRTRRPTETSGSHDWRYSRRPPTSWASSASATTASNRSTYWYSPTAGSSGSLARPMELEAERLHEAEASLQRAVQAFTAVAASSASLGRRACTARGRAT
jgi:hypothetical protein